ncbi:hypothetical protein WA026_006048 [Henosepilachna vigintioctopunctata]|uniref:HMG box domain-containing protein n=1 Tax=Henosepilachna vigintioctopunctata TaxID=420089 RepID=A0AAW1TJF8_9CUCU
MSYSLGHSLFAPASSTFIALARDNRASEANNNQIMVGTSDKIEEIWNKNTFKTDKVDMALSLNSMKVTSWINENVSKADDDTAQEPEKVVEPQEHEEEPVLELQETPKEDQSSPSHHARRPMNAFLIFCKKHRPIVRDRFPNLENRGVTKILGEWWSLLEEDDKMPFTNLANEYKDAFLSANPDFKWYKLPAPPLRTLTVRPPSCITKLPSPQSSPSHTSAKIFNEFTPGKLADESQLGSLSSLLNNNSSPLGHKVVDCCENRKYTSMDPITEMGENNNKIEKCDTSLHTPLNSIKTAATLPPKPIKKRLYPKISESNTKEVSKNILNTECNEIYTCFQKEHQHQAVDTMTNQDIVDKVVDNLFVEKDMISNEQIYVEDKTRKSGRQCKGKRYEKFMVEGKLLGNKKDTKLTQNKQTNITKETSSEFKGEMMTPNLENTIKRLAERTKIPFVQNEDEDMPLFPKEEKEDICGSETSESLTSTNFNLDLKISNLPCLSYDAFIQKKRESKKRKLRKVSSENLKNGEKEMKKQQMLVGSKKRKNKQSITHLEKKEEVSNFNDLLGLATLAEIAANTQKINES